MARPLRSIGKTLLLVLCVTSPSQRAPAASYESRDHQAPPHPLLPIGFVTFGDHPDWQAYAADGLTDAVWGYYGADSLWRQKAPVRFHLMMSGGMDRNAILATVAKYKNHPSVTSWMIPEEPWACGWTTERINELLAEMKAIDPNRPIGILPENNAIPKLAEVPGFDFAIVQTGYVHLGCHTDFAYTTTASAVQVFKKPVWGLIKVSGWQPDRFRETGSVPSLSKLRCIAYLMLNAGAQGVFFWPWGYRHESEPKATSPPEKEIGRHNAFRADESLLRDVRTLARELQFYSEALRGTRPTGLSVRCSNPGIRCRLYQAGEDVYLIAVNDKETIRNATSGHPFLRTRSVHVKAQLGTSSGFIPSDEQVATGYDLNFDIGAATGVQGLVFPVDDRHPTRYVIPGARGARVQVARTLRMFIRNARPTTVRWALYEDTDRDKLPERKMQEGTVSLADTNETYRAVEVTIGDVQLEPARSYMLLVQADNDSTCMPAQQLTWRPWPASPKSKMNDFPATIPPTFEGVSQSATFKFSGPDVARYTHWERQTGDDFTQRTTEPLKKMFRASFAPYSVHIYKLRCVED